MYVLRVWRSRNVCHFHEAAHAPAPAGRRTRGNGIEEDEPIKGVPTAIQENYCRIVNATQRSCAARRGRLGSNGMSLYVKIRNLSLNEMRRGVCCSVFAKRLSSVKPHRHLQPRTVYGNSHERAEKSRCQFVRHSACAWVMTNDNLMRRNFLRWLFGSRM